MRLTWGLGPARAGAALWVVAALLALPVVLALTLAAAVTGVAGAPLPPSAGPASPVGPLPTWVVTQPYGCTGFGLEPARGSCPHFHFGVDLAAPPGTAVTSVLAGQAEVFPPAGYGGGYGLHVVVHHGQGLDTMYAHLADVSITQGQRVVAGGVLGHEGSTGMSTGPHLHFEVRQAGIAVDPVSVFPGIFGPEGQPRSGVAAR